MTTTSEAPDTRIVSLSQAISEGDTEVLSTLSKLLGYSVEQVSSDPLFVSFTLFYSDRYSKALFLTNVAEPIYQQFLSDKE